MQFDYLCVRCAEPTRESSHEKRILPAVRSDMSTDVRTQAKADSAGIPTIDMSAIVKMGDEGNEGIEFVVNLISIFLQDMSQRVVKIGNQATAKDTVGIAASAHAIKGSCSHFGALPLMALCGKLESQARRGEIDGIELLIESMVAETERVRTALEAYRSSASI
jgi:HPt (histidine-containing phosphotransfer) domain-containing protein